MSVYELNEDQKNELKENYITEMAKLEDRTPSYGELANATKVPDELIYKLYADITFSPDDFWCTAGGC